MDDSTEQRLQDLQLADLGTSRREQISTAIDSQDKKQLGGITKQRLEASRLSNQNESVRRVTEKNKLQLSAWTNFHTRIDDIAGMEPLDSLMDGQSHRAQLSTKVIQEYGGQTYLENPIEEDSSHQKARTRDARVIGRGGGNVGRRGRGSTRSSSHSRGGSADRHTILQGHHIKEIQRHLDPALGPRTRSISGNRGKKDPKLKVPGIKVRRAMQSNSSQISQHLQPNYSSALAEPEDFLEAFRKSTSASTNSHDNVVMATETTSRDTLEKPQSEGAKASTDLLDFGPHAKVTVSSVTENQVSWVTKNSSLPLAAAKNEETSSLLDSQPSSHPEPLLITPKSSSAKLSKDPLPKGPGARDSENDYFQEKTRHSVVFSSNLPQPQIMTPKSNVQESKLRKTQLDENNDLLLDFSTTLSGAEKVSAEREAAQSPSVRDLMEIDFQHTSKTPPQSPAFFQQVPISSVTPGFHLEAETENTMAPKTCRSIDSKPSTAKKNAVIYLQELGLINDILPSLNAEDAVYLISRQQKLVKLISEANEGEGSHNLSQSPARYASEMPTGMKSLLASPSDEKTLFIQKGRQHGVEVQQTEPTSSSRDVSQSETRLRNAVLAKPFVPRSNSSSESPARHPRELSIPKDHVFDEQEVLNRSRGSSSSTTGSVLRPASHEWNPHPRRQLSLAATQGDSDIPVVDSRASPTPGRVADAPYSIHAKSVSTSLTPASGSLNTQAHPHLADAAIPLSGFPLSDFQRNEHLESIHGSPTAVGVLMRPLQIPVTGENSPPAPRVTAPPEGSFHASTHTLAVDALSSGVIPPVQSHRNQSLKKSSPAPIRDLTASRWATIDVPVPAPKLNQAQQRSGNQSTTNLNSTFWQNSSKYNPPPNQSVHSIDSSPPSPRLASQVLPAHGLYRSMHAPR